MDRKAFQIWLSEIDELTEAQKLAVADVLAGREIGGAARAAIEVGVGVGESVEDQRGMAGKERPDVRHSLM